MKRVMTVGLSVALVVLVAGIAFAQMGRGPMAGGMGPGMMGGGMMGPGMMGGAAGQAGCPGMTAAGAQAGTPAAQLTEDKAKELAQQYADKYLKGFTVDKVLPVTMMHGTMFSVELKDPKDELRVLHINPWGNVMPMGGPWRRAS